VITIQAKSPHMSSKGRHPGMPRSGDDRLRLWVCWDGRRCLNTLNTLLCSRHSRYDCCLLPGGLTHVCFLNLSYSFSAWTASVENSYEPSVLIMMAAVILMMSAGSRCYASVLTQQATRYTATAYQLGSNPTCVIMPPRMGRAFHVK
jgi:hypothetical protein